MGSDPENCSNFSMNPLDPEEFRRQGHMVIDFLADYYHDQKNFPVRSQVPPGYLRKNNSPTCTKPHSSHTLAVLRVSLDFLAINVVAFNWMSSPAATELEHIVMDWLGKMLDLPTSFLFSGGGGGVLQGTTCEAILCTLVAARDQKLRQYGVENIGKLVVYCSDQTHSALEKGAQIAGIINPKNFRIIRTDKCTNFSLPPKPLLSAILSDVKAGLIPFYLCATIGTTSSTAVDPLGPICEVVREYDIWVHVDAAYAGSACICPEFCHFLDGIEDVNSFSFNAHNPLDCCCCLWVKNPSALIRALSTNAEYLKNKASESKQVVDYKDWQIQLSRRFRALKLWLVLRSYGVGKLRTLLRGHVEMAKHFEGLVLMDKRFEVVVPRFFSMVCFRIAQSAIYAVL